MWGWVQVTLDVTLKNVTLTENLFLNSYFENPTIGRSEERRVGKECVP